MAGRPEQAGVAAADADGVVAVGVDGGDELRVDLTDEHHPGDVDRLGVGDAQPSRNSAVLPRRPISAEICGPPPWTTTGRIPTRRISTMSWAKTSRASCSDVPAMALPPYLTTTVLPAKRRMYGSASTRTSARRLSVTAAFRPGVRRQPRRQPRVPGARGRQTRPGAGSRRSRRGRGRRWRPGWRRRGALGEVVEAHRTTT